MAHTLERMKGRATHSNFIGLPRHVADSVAFVTLPAWTRALYVDLRRQYNGNNNGDISAADGMLRQYGWPHSTIHKGLRLLIKHKLIEKTRQGGIASMSRITTLYGFTDMAVVGNPAKGIRGAMATLAYKEINVTESSGQKNDAKVHPVNAKVHAVDFQRYMA